jgi:murein DD-endopeptidase MepM/ murein hydrolase activator NlpD
VPTGEVGDMEDERGERGQAAPLMALVLVFAGVLALGAARLGRAAADRAQARTAADAAALAGAVGDRAGAEALALANGGRLVAYRTIEGDVLVTVRVGPAEASARARPRVRSVAGTEAVAGFALPIARDAVPVGAWRQPHHDRPALDLPAPIGTSVAALAGGRVRWVTDGACGIGVSIDIGPGVRYVYCHGAARTVPDGASVRAGQEVLRSGNTGRSTGPHLHLGLFVDGVASCPQPLLAALIDGRPPPDWRALRSARCVG